MQTIYYTTPNFIHHTSNVVDFTEYRRKLALAEEGSLAPKPQVEDFEAEVCGEGWEQPVLREIKPRRSRQRQRRALVLDLCASVAVVALTVGALMAFLGL